MSKLLNLQELIYNNNRVEKMKSDYFNLILSRCHNLIKRYNQKEKIKACTFNVPIYTFGEPLYDYYELLNFLYKSLKENGLYVKIINNNSQLYISWDAKHVNMEAYTNAKQKQKEELFISNIEIPTNDTVNERPNKKNENNDNNLLLHHDIVVNKTKYLQAQKIQNERDKFYKQLCESKKLEAYKNT
jgi:hypothetical protein